MALIGSPLSLQARTIGNGLILSWPVDLVGYMLQWTFSLAPPVSWIDSTNSPAVFGAYFSVSSASSGSAQFFRLRKP